MERFDDFLQKCTQYLDGKYYKYKWVLPEQTINLIHNVAKFIISICRRQFELQNEPVHLVDADGDGHTLLNGMFNQTLCVEHHLAEIHKGLGYTEGWRNQYMCRRSVGLGEHQKGKNKWLTPSAASMKRTTPSEIRMLDVTSSEKFTWPLRETWCWSFFESIIIFCSSDSTFKECIYQIKHPV